MNNQNFSQGQSQFGNNQKVYQPSGFVRSTYNQGQTPDFGTNQPYQSPQSYRTPQYYANQQSQQNQILPQINQQQYQQNPQGQFGMNTNQFGSQQNQIGSQQNQMGAQQNQIGAQQNQIGAQQNQFGSYIPSQVNRAGSIGTSTFGNISPLRNTFTGSSSIGGGINTSNVSPQSYRMSNYYGNQPQNQQQSSQQFNNQTSLQNNTGFYNQGR